MTRSLRIAVVVLVALGALSLSSVAMAQEDYPPSSPPPGDVLPDDEVKGGVIDPDNGGVLPFTGGQVIMFVVAGAGLIALGTLMYRRSRNEAGIT